MKKMAAMVLIAFFAFFLAGGCGEEGPPAAVPTEKIETVAEPDTLISAKTPGTVALDAKNLDPAWNKAAELRLQLAGGAYFQNGATDLTLKSLHTDKDIFFLVKWSDATVSLMSTPMVKQPDGTWKFGDYLVNFEDQLGFLWNINDTIKDFNSQGCAVACHPGEGIPEGGAFGKMYTAAPGENGDIWVWKAPRNDVFDFRPGIDAYAEDWALDSFNIVDINIREGGAGRFLDPGKLGYEMNATPDHQKPMYQWREMPADPVERSYLFADNLVDLVDSDWQAGDWIPTIIQVMNPSGDVADIMAAANFAGGQWTLVLKRKLVTESTVEPPVDIQFSDLSKTYYFGISAFDNSEQHAFYSKPLMLRFRDRE